MRAECFFLAAPLQRYSTTLFVEAGLWDCQVATVGWRQLGYARPTKKKQSPEILKFESESVIQI
jgi:hypothetical protein